MKIVNRGRGTGKTTILIHTAYVTGYPIIVYSEDRARQVRTQAIELGCKDIEVMSYEELKRYYPRNVLTNKILVDESSDFLELALSKLLQGEVVGCTMTIPLDYDNDTKREDSDNE